MALPKHLVSALLGLLMFCTLQRVDGRYIPFPAFMPFIHTPPVYGHHNPIYNPFDTTYHHLHPHNWAQNDWPQWRDGSPYFDPYLYDLRWPTVSPFLDIPNPNPVQFFDSSDHQPEGQGSANDGQQSEDAIPDSYRNLRNKQMLEQYRGQHYYGHQQEEDEHAN